MSYISWDLVFDIIKYVPCDDLRSLSKASPMFDEVFVQMDLKVIIHKGIARVPKMTDLIIVTNSGQYIEYKEHCSYYENIDGEVCLKCSVSLTSDMKADCELNRIKFTSAIMDNFIVHYGIECHDTNLEEGIIRCIDLKNKMAFSKDRNTISYCYSLRRFRVLMKYGQWAN